MATPAEETKAPKAVQAPPPPPPAPPVEPPAAPQPVVSKGVSYFTTLILEWPGSDEHSDPIICIPGDAIDVRKPSGEVVGTIRVGRTGEMPVNMEDGGINLSVTQPEGAKAPA